MDYHLGHYGMPNQRRKDKTKLQIWMTEKEKKALEKLAKKHEVSVAELLRRLATGAIKLSLWLLLAHSAYAFSQRPEMTQRGVERAVSAGAKLMHQNILAVIRHA